MATISTVPKILTLINVFTVDPQNQEKLLETLIDATETTMKRMQGFISASIHKSFDGTKVVNYAQWLSREDFEAMTAPYEGMRGAGDVRPHLVRGSGFPECQGIVAGRFERVGRRPIFLRKNLFNGCALVDVAEIPGLMLCIGRATRYAMHHRQSTTPSRSSISRA